MDEFVGAIGYLNAVLVFCVLVFVHEFGHYAIARWAGVRVEVFSIGFGRELFGHTDRFGTRWKFSLIPLGGYIKMRGETIAANTPDEAGAADSFQTKSLGARAAIVAAGPMANFLFAMLALTVLFMVVGRSVPVDFGEAGIGGVQPGSAAEQAGFQAGDRILAVDGRPIATFADLRDVVGESAGAELPYLVERDGAQLVLRAAARPRDGSGEGASPSGYLLGVTGPAPLVEKQGPGAALLDGARQTVVISWMTLGAVYEIITGSRSSDEVGGPVKIVQMSHDAGQLGWASLLTFAAILSINLGLLNLFPVPMLDGGHLVFFAYEAVRGRPLPLRIQEYALRGGLALLLALIVLVTVNDVLSLPG